MQVLAGAAALAFGPAWASEKPRKLSLHNIHTGENLDVEYGSGVGYDRAARSEIDHFFRCHYTGESIPMDGTVVDLLSDLQQRLGRDRLRIISGYRSPVYNELLRKEGRGAAAGSLHLKGLAIDFAAPRVGTDEVFRLARSFQVGGVGKYPDFVHIDSGRVRYW